MKTSDDIVTIDYHETSCLPNGQDQPQSKWGRLLKTPFVGLLPSLTLAVVLWFGMTPTYDLSPTAIHVLAIFIRYAKSEADGPDTDPWLLYLRNTSSCIFALMTTSFSVTILVMTALVILSLTRSFQCTEDSTGASVECRLCGTSRAEVGGSYDCNGGQQALAHSLEGFSSTVVWLVFASFHLGKAVEITGLGKRLSLWMVRIFGKHILGLAYSIVFSGTVQNSKKKNDLDLRFTLLPS